MLTKILNFHALASTRGLFLRLLALFFCFLYLFSTPLQAQQGSPAFINLVEKLKKNVISITAVFPDGHEENGFGFVTGEKDGKLYLVTAGHVVHRKGGGKAKTIQVKVSNSFRPVFAEEESWFEADDLSLLFMYAIPGYQWEKNCLGKDPAAYDKVRFIGKEKEWVSPGEGEVISLKPDRILFTISTVAPGTSGAPLVGENGIIGMVIEDANSSSVALPISRIRALIGGANYPYFSALEVPSSSSSKPDLPCLQSTTPGYLGLGGTSAAGGAIFLWGISKYNTANNWYRNTYSPDPLAVSLQEFTKYKNDYTTNSKVFMGVGAAIVAVGAVVFIQKIAKVSSHNRDCADGGLSLASKPLLRLEPLLHSYGGTPGVGFALQIQR